MNRFFMIFFYPAFSPRRSPVKRVPYPLVSLWCAITPSPSSFDLSVRYMGVMLCLKRASPYRVII